MYGPKAACTMTQDETRPPAPSANLCASDTMPGMGSNTWIIDTGASDHMTYDTNMFDELSHNPRDPYITSANGLPSPVTGEGSQDSREDWACFMPVLKYFELITENGVSERKNRQLLEVARSLMLDMSVPHHLCRHGVLAAAYLINRTPSRVLDFQTPLDVLCAHTPPVSVSKLPPKLFGCVAYVHIYSHQRSKLDPCALRCVFIGYSTTQKGYKWYHPPSQKVHVTLDVTFHEEVPYYVSSSSPIQGERGSELKSFGMEDLGCTEASEVISDDAPTIGRLEDATDRQAVCANPTGRTEGNDRSPLTMRDECVETTVARQSVQIRPVGQKVTTGRQLNPLMRFALRQKNVTVILVTPAKMRLI
ncbi:unnamed protein product [Prunus brigantina]